MSYCSQPIWVASNKDTHFTSATVTTALDSESLPIGPGVTWNASSSPPSYKQFMILAVTFAYGAAPIVSMTGWRLWFWKKSTYNTVISEATLADDNLIGILEFDETQDARIMSTATDMEWFTDHDVNLPYCDMDAQSADYTKPRVHVSLQPIGATKPASDADNRFVVKVCLQPLF